MNTLEIFISSLTINSCIIFALIISIDNSYRKRKNLKFLKYFFISSAAYYFVLFFWLRQETNLLIHLFPMVLPVFLAIIPSFYIFILSLTKLHISRKTLFLNYLPSALFVLLIMPFYFLPHHEKLDFLNSNLNQNSSLLSSLIYKTFIFGVSIVINTQIFTYIFLFIKTFTHYNTEIEKRFSFKEKINLKWAVVLTFFVLILIFMLNFADLIGIGNSLKAGIIFNLFSTAVFYFLFLKGINQKYIFNEQKLSTEKIIDVETAQSTDKYQKSFLKPDEKIRISHDLDETIKNRDIFLKKNLNIEFLAKKLNTNTAYLSQIINEQYNSNFFNFVNKIRIQKASELLLSPEHEKFTIEALAELCGFGSRTSFYEAFKKIHKITPSQYKKLKSKQ